MITAFNRSKTFGYELRNFIEEKALKVCAILLKCCKLEGIDEPNKFEDRDSFVEKAKGLLKIKKKSKLQADSAWHKFVYIVCKFGEENAILKELFSILNEATPDQKKL